MATDDEREPSASDDSLADQAEAPARKPARAAKATKKAARPAPARSEDEDEDEDLDDEDEDLDDEDEDEGDDEPPPPRKVSRAAADKKAPVSKKAPVKKKKTVVVKRVPAKPASHFLPFSILGMLMIGGHVFWDVAFAPLAVLGISVVVWSYMGIGSANEPV